jgi:amino acid transporter
MTELKKTLGGVQLFSMGFGSIVGVGWIVLMGFWFQQAGPGGTAVAFLLGGLLLALVGLCYGEMSTMLPVAGGEASFAYAAFGTPIGFVIGWAMTLMMIAVVPYVSISLGWLLDTLIPGFAGPVIYSWRGSPVYAVSLAVSVAWTLFLGITNYRGIQAAAKLQDIFTYGKILLSFVFFAAAVIAGSVANTVPAFTAPEGRSTLSGMVSVLAMTPWFFGGFNFIPQVLEEKSAGTSLKLVGRVIVGSLLAAAVYYAIAAFTTGMVAPWPKVVGQDLPTAAAFRIGFGSETFARLVLLAGIFGIITVGNGVAIGAARLVFALSRARMITPVFERLHPVYRSPTAAIAFVIGIGVLGNFLGRNGIAPIVNVGSTCSALGYLATCLGVLRFRQREPNRERPYKIPMGSLVAVLGAAASVFLLLSSIRQQWYDAKGGFPVEWLVLIIWGVIGVGFWYGGRTERAAQPEAERRKTVFGAGSAGA